MPSKSLIFPKMANDTKILHSKKWMNSVIFKQASWVVSYWPRPLNLHDGYSNTGPGFSMSLCFLLYILFNCMCGVTLKYYSLL